MSEIIEFQSRASDQRRFESIVQPHFEALYGAASRLAATSADAEDLVQEVCLKAFIKLSDLELIEHQRAWLLRVLYNVFIDGVRRTKRSPVDLADDSYAAEELPQTDARHLQPEEAADRLISLELLLNAMNVLNKDHCALLALHDIDGYTVTELSSLTGLAESNIKSRMHRTRIKLGRLLKNNVSGRPNLTVVGT
jgi:RNA polymerase sigma-70 factor (ECF subfamily)